MFAATDFTYDKAFARNIGLLTRREQSLLKNTCVGLPGLGGVGGVHLQALARMGVGAFKLADPDSFDLVNFNRQSGATMQTVGRCKTEVMTEAVRAINPEAEVTGYPAGITPENIDSFLAGVDVVVDGIEFFCVDARRMLYAACRKRGIPVVNAGPIGYGAAVMVFMPGAMSFDDYFGITAVMTRAEQLLAFGLGLSPRLVSDIDPACVDIEAQKGPALASACFLCAGAAATEVLKLVCGRGQPIVAPNGRYYDLYRGKTVRLRRRPALHGLAGRAIRWFSFRQFPAFKAMHDREIAARTS